MPKSLEQYHCEQSEYIAHALFYLLSLTDEDAQSRFFEQYPDLLDPYNNYMSFVSEGVSHA